MQPVSAVRVQLFIGILCYNLLHFFHSLFGQVHFSHRLQTFQEHQIERHRSYPIDILGVAANRAGTCYLQKGVDLRLVNI